MHLVPSQGWWHRSRAHSKTYLLPANPKQAKLAHSKTYLLPANPKQAKLLHRKGKKPAMHLVPSQGWWHRSRAHSKTYLLPANPKQAKLLHRKGKKPEELKNDTAPEIPARSPMAVLVRPTAA